MAKKTASRSGVNMTVLETLLDAMSGDKSNLTGHEERGHMGENVLSVFSAPPA